MHAEGSARSPLQFSRSSSIRPIPQKHFTQNASLIKPPLLVQNILIILDPGHGGHDVGTQSISKPRYQEKSLNLVTAQFVRDFLQQLGYQVFMTREEDTFVSLDKRAQLANDQKPIFLSASTIILLPVRKRRGSKSFFISPKIRKRTLKSKRLAQSILKNVLVIQRRNREGSSKQILQ